MDNQAKTDWCKGFTWFCVLMLLIAMFTTTPDGVTLFAGFFGLFGIPHTLRIGGAFYWLNIVHIVLVIVCIVRTHKFWRGYSRKFWQLNSFLTVLPVIMVILMFFGNGWSLNFIDRAYFNALSRREGFNAVTIQADSLSNQIFEITNHGQTFVTFKIMVVDIWGNETILEDGFGDPALYTMPPQSSLVTGHYNIFFSVLLIDEEGEQHQPITLRR